MTNWNKILTLKEVEVSHNSKQNPCILHCHQQCYQVPTQPEKNKTDNGFQEHVKKQRQGNGKEKENFKWNVVIVDHKKRALKKFPLHSSELSILFKELKESILNLPRETNYI